ncbi:ABC transporter permease [Lipingzhangella sp. LS1_29]|uniref:ABC transporter permease n=1 Tax=Lipingzhangella rawalii TaxID=2055835 RepID=A0ABU2H2P0_9ACTN|nr:ABC transporter permease [Lipingzhangella rawalii]MDS1269557.1 ABC transporter permease [Lipingzhangella rawalii]
MIAYTLRRIGLAGFVSLGVVLLTFAIGRIVPGDPAGAWAGPRAGPEQRERIREELGLDAPVPEQFVTYIWGVLRGDWGVSVRTHRPVLEDLSILLPNTFQLVFAGLFLGVLLGVPAGLLAAHCHNRLPDFGIRLGGLLGAAMPVFWLALMLQLLFSSNLGWLPINGIYDRSVENAYPLSEVTGAPVVDSLITGNWPMFLSSLEHLILPAIVVAAYPFAIVTRIVRANVLDTLGEGHIQLTRALGFSESAVLGRFALRSAWNPVLQVSALIFGSSLVNTFLVESVFTYPGLGNYAAAAAKVQDIPAIVGVTLLVALCYLAANLAVDLLHAALDPRIRLR